MLIFAAWWGEYLADVLAGTWTSEYDLPLQLTDAISAVAVLALWTRRPALVELLYFWSLTATLQAVITPDLAQNFPSVYYFTYFTYHLGAIVGACLLVFGCGLYPRPGAALRVFWITLAWAAVAGTADLLTGGNYMYLRAKPEHGSLLSVMGPWPWYILATIALALALLMTLELLTPVRRSDPAARTRAVLRPRRARFAPAHREGPSPGVSGDGVAVISVSAGEPRCAPARYPARCCSSIGTVERVGAPAATVLSPLTTVALAKGTLPKSASASVRQPRGPHVEGASTIHSAEEVSMCELRRIVLMRAPVLRSRIRRSTSWPRTVTEADS